MLKNSNDASCKDKNKEIDKKLDIKEKPLNPCFGSEEFIPIDKDVPETKEESRHQRDRSQQKFNHYKSNYYNTNRYPNRNGFNSNSLPGNKSGNTLMRGHQYKNTHVNYHGNLNNSYTGANAGASNYNRSKRKRDSSAISVHGEGKNHNRNILYQDTTNVISEGKLSTDGQDSTSPSDNRAPQGIASLVGSEIQVDGDDDDFHLSTKNNSKAKTKQSKVAPDAKVLSNNSLSNETGHLEKRKPCNESLGTHNFPINNDKNVHRSHIYGKYKTSADIDFSRKRDYKENSGIKTHLEHKSLRSKNEGHLNLQSINSSITEKQIPVWFKGKAYGGGVIGLHEEIEDFFQWMVPTAIEHENRIKVVSRIRQVIQKLWPHAKVDIFGSFKTGLYLPTSDIDLVVVGKWSDPPLYTLYEELLKSEIPKPDEIVVLDKAAVPIIKLTEKLTDIKVDISFNTVNGIRAAELIKFYRKHYPSLPKLIYVLKQFLLQRNLNEVFTGGLSSYALILMAVSFLQLHPRNDASTLKTNLGVLLLEFFDLYGRTFNYSQSAIRLRDGGAYVPRDEILRTLPNINSSNNGVTLCIEDPLDSHNDVGKGSFLFYRVKSTFEDAYITLRKELGTRKLFKEPGNIENTDSHENINLDDSGGDCNSILSRIISVSDEIQQFRKNLVEQHSTSQKSLPESVRRESSERNQNSSNILQLSNNRESRSGDINTMTPDKENNVNKGETDNKISSGTRCTESKASLERSQNVSSEKVKHTSDDPSAPIYPPRSPTSDIVPTELPPCHVLSAKAFLAENTNMCQVDGNAEIPMNKELPSSVILDQTEQDIMVLFDESNKLPKNISHSSSSSSVSSNGSRASSSVRESMSDTQSDEGGPTNQQLPSDSSNSSMSISPAISEVGSPRATLSSKGNTTSTRALFNDLTSFNIKKGIKKSASGNFGEGINKDSASISSGRRIRTSSHSSNTSSFSSSSKIGSRKELDRADMDLDWRSTSRLRCSSGSSEDSIKSKKSNDKLPSQVNRADRDLNWRNHDDIKSNSFTTNQRGNWRNENQRRQKKSESDKTSGNSTDTSSSNDEGATKKCNKNSSKFEGSSRDIVQTPKISNKVLSGRSFRDAILSSKESENKTFGVKTKFEDSADVAKEDTSCPSPTPSSLSSCSSLNASPLLASSSHNSLKGANGRETNRRRKTKNKTQHSLIKNGTKTSDENLTSNDIVNGRQEQIDNVPTEIERERERNDNSLNLGSVAFESIPSKNSKLNSKTKIHDNSSSPTNCSCSSVVNNYSNRNRFSNKLGHKKSKR